MEIIVCKIRIYLIINHVCPLDTTNEDDTKEINDSIPTDSSTPLSPNSQVC